MNTYIEPGITLEYTAPGGGVVSGTPVLIGGVVIIPSVTVAAAARFNGMTSGVFKVPKTVGAAWVEGQTLYFDSATTSFTTAQSATARRAGYATAAALSADVLGYVSLVNIGAAVNVA